MRNFTFVLFLTLTVNTLLAMENDKAIVPVQSSKELAKKETKFEALVDKIHDNTGDFDLLLGTLEGTDIPVIVIDGNEFVILDGNISAKSLDLSFKGMNLVLLANMEIDGKVDILCENMIIFGDIKAQGDISIKTDNKFLGFGTQINAEGKLSLEAQSDLVLDVMYKSDKELLYNNIRRALANNDIRHLGHVTLKILEAASPKKPELKPIQ